MQRVTVADAGRQFVELIERVTTEGITIELERNHEIVARISPTRPRVLVADLNRVFASLPSLGDDSESFAEDVLRTREELPRENNAWE